MGASQGDAATDGLLSETSGIASTFATSTAAAAADRPTSPFARPLLPFLNGEVRGEFLGLASLPKAFPFTHVESPRDPSDCNIQTKTAAPLLEPPPGMTLFDGRLCRVLPPPRCQPHETCAEKEEGAGLRHRGHIPDLPRVQVGHTCKTSGGSAEYYVLRGTRRGERARESEPRAQGTRRQRERTIAEGHGTRIATGSGIGHEELSEVIVATRKSVDGIRDIRECIRCGVQQSIKVHVSSHACRVGASEYVPKRVGLRRVERDASGRDRGGGPAVMRFEQRARQTDIRGAVSAERRPAPGDGRCTRLARDQYRADRDSQRPWNACLRHHLASFAGFPSNHHSTEKFLVHGESLCKMAIRITHRLCPSTPLSCMSLFFCAEL